MTDPTLSDCINYMKQQFKGMEKYQKSYEFNIPYYRKTIEYLEQRPHGEWKKEPLTDNTAWYVCSVCGDKVCCQGNNFCPNCGADMRKEGDSDA